jgi:hypothetical protein
VNVTKVGLANVRLQWVGMAITVVLLARPVAAQTEPPRVFIKDVKGCQFLNPYDTALGRYEWSGECKDGFVSGTGTLSYPRGNISWTGDFVAGELRRGVLRMTGGTVYEGDFKNNHRHGRGTLRFLDGTTLTCLFTNNSSGPGLVVLERQDGSRYEGEYDHANNLIEGRGKATYPNGSVYEGMWHKGVIDGEGVYKLANGDVQTGTFAQGLLTGTGSIEYASGAKYTGAFTAGTLSGFGTAVYANGNVYEGEYLGNAAHGAGKLTSSDGRVLEGQWEANTLNGECSFKAPYFTRRGTCVNSKLQGAGHLEDSRTNVVYDGEFLDDMFHGQGVLQGKDYRYEGEFVRGEKQGRGKETTVRDDYEGEFAGGRREGQGRLKRTAQGGVPVVYEGQFAAGQPHGQGAMIFPTVRVDGEFEKGRLLRGKLDAGERKFEVDMVRRSFLEVLPDGRKRGIGRKVLEGYGIP